MSSPANTQPGQYEFPFADASRSGSLIRMGISGPAGSGKTFTILDVMTVMADAIGGTVGMIDTERGSARKYAPPFRFKHMPWTGPYDMKRFTRSLAEAADQGITHLGVDSLSKFWSGAGGTLEAVDRDSGKGVAGWKNIRPIENEMWEAMLAYPGHLYVGMRVKTAYEVTRNATTGKQEVVKLGLAPEQRSGQEYEFDITGTMDQSNTLTIDKTRVIPLHGAQFSPPNLGASLAEFLVAWLNEVPPERTALDFKAAALAATTLDEIRALRQEAWDAQLNGAALLGQSGELLSLDGLLVARGDEIHGSLRQAAPPLRPVPAAPVLAAAPAPEAPAAAIIPAAAEPAAAAGSDPAILANWTRLVGRPNLSAAGAAQLAKGIEQAVAAGTLTKMDAAELTGRLPGMAAA
jgi:AAA domain